MAQKNDDVASVDQLRDALTDIFMSIAAEDEQSSPIVGLRDELEKGVEDGITNYIHKLKRE